MFKANPDTPTNFQIETGVPLPTDRRRTFKRTPTSPLRLKVNELKVGQSLFPLTKSQAGNARTLVNRRGFTAKVAPSAEDPAKFRLWVVRLKRTKGGAKRRVNEEVAR